MGVKICGSRRVKVIYFPAAAYRKFSVEKNTPANLALSNINQSVKSFTGKLWKKCAIK